MRKILLSALAAFLFLLPSAARATTYIIDPEYSAVFFRIPHLVGHANGQIKTFSGNIEVDDKTSTLKDISADLDATSLTTFHEKRDVDLKSDRFFNVAKFPKASFRLKKIEETMIRGDLTLKGVTKPVALNYKILGAAKDQFDRRKLAISIVGQIDRKDFGITFNEKIDDGRMLLGDTVDLYIDLQAIHKDDLKIKVNR